MVVRRRLGAWFSVEGWSEGEFEDAPSEKSRLVVLGVCVVGELGLVVIIGGGGSWAFAAMLGE